MSFKDFVVNPSSSVRLFANEHADNTTTVKPGVDHSSNDFVTLRFRLLLQRAIEKTGGDVISFCHVMLFHDLRAHDITLVMEAKENSPRHNSLAYLTKIMCSITPHSS
jgi:hypothetical protein